MPVREIPEAEKAIPVEVRKIIQAPQEHTEGQGLIFLRVSFPTKDDVEVNPFEFLAPELQKDVQDAGYLSLEVPKIDPKNAPARRKLAHESFRLVKRLHCARDIWDQALSLRQLLTIQDIGA